MLCTLLLELERVTDEASKLLLLLRRQQSQHLPLRFKTQLGKSASILKLDVASFLS
jgi:hypothetical protein